MRGSAKPVDELCVLGLHPEPLPELVKGLSRGCREAPNRAP